MLIKKFVDNLSARGPKFPVKEWVNAEFRWGLNPEEKKYPGN